MAPDTPEVTSLLNTIEALNECMRRLTTLSGGLLERKAGNH